MCGDSCSSHGVCQPDKSCKCLSGYGGPDCSCESVPKVGVCSGHGLCERGTCFCNPGYGGRVCSSTVCPNQCSARGTCNLATAKCDCMPGFEGSDCSHKACFRNCSGNGLCYDDMCVCHGDWQGGDCSVRRCTNDCSNNGVCQADGRCMCSSRFAGEDCSRPLCPNYCWVSKGHGRCYNGDCVCSDGWGGNDCSKHSCSGEEHGLWNNMTSVCECSARWTGSRCEDERCPDDCGQKKERGICKDGTCLCQWGFTGSSCGIVICPHSCSGHGKCEKDFGCSCLDGYTGATCEVPPAGTFTEQLAQSFEDFPYKGPDADRLTHKTMDAATLNDGAVRPAPLQYDAVVGPTKAYARVDTSVRSIRLPTPHVEKGQEGKPVVDPASENICPSSCNFKGTCMKGQCFCYPGFAGIACAIDKAEIKSRGRLRKALVKIGNTLAKLSPKERTMLGVK